MNTELPWILSTMEPFCSACVAGVKTVENRSRRPPAASIGKWYLLHASKGRNYLDNDRVMGEVEALWPACPPNFKLGYLLGFVRLTGAYPLAQLPPEFRSGWVCGPLCWTITQARALREPIQWAGKVYPYQLSTAEWNQPGMEEVRAVYQELIDARAHTQ